MKVLLLIWNYWPALEGGSERQARQVAAELVRRGHTCTVWTARHDASWPLRETHEGVTIQRFGRRVPWLSRCQRLWAGWHRPLKYCVARSSPSLSMRYETFRQAFDFWMLLPATWLARRSFMQDVVRQVAGTHPAPDIIHLHEPSWLGGFAVKMAQPWRIPVLCQEATNPALPVLGYDVPDRNEIGRWRRQAHFIAMASYLADDLQARGIPAERVHVLPNGVRIPDTMAQPEKSGPVLYVGNFSQGAHWKAFDVLFKAWGMVHRNNPGARLVVLGGGDFAPWKRYADQQGCENSVDFIGRVDNPGHYYQRACLFMLPSRIEGMSNALLEAQSWGVPCVVSDIPGNRAVVQNGVNGRVVPVNDPHALAAATLQLLTDAGERRRLGVAGRALAEQTFDINQVIDALMKLYRDLISHGGGDS